MRKSRNRTPKADSKLVRQIVERRFGTRSFKKAAAIILDQAWITRSDGTQVRRTVLPDGTELELPTSEKTIMAFFAGRGSDYWRALSNVLGVNFEVIRKGSLGPTAAHLDQTALALELSDVRTQNDLIDLMTTQRHTFGTREVLGQLLREDKNPSRLLRLAAGAVIDGFTQNSEEVGTICTLLATNLDVWRPAKTVLDKLSGLCRGALEVGLVGQIAVVEPLTFWLAAKGRPTVHRRCLQLVIEEEAWRFADAARIGAYYGDQQREILSYRRHLADPRRSGHALLVASDAARLMNLLSLPNPVLQRPVIRGEIRGMLTTAAEALWHGGEDGLTRAIERFTQHV